jgi:hypothetical protein
MIWGRKSLKGKAWGTTVRKQVVGVGIQVPIVEQPTPDVQTGSHKSLDTISLTFLNEADSSVGSTAGRAIA